jgi:carbonic anhydrase
VGRLCELNALEQVRNVCRTNVVQDAWRRGQQLSVHLDAIFADTVGATRRSPSP